MALIAKAPAVTWINNNKFMAKPVSVLTSFVTYVILKTTVVGDYYMKSNDLHRMKCAQPTVAATLVARTKVCTLDADNSSYKV